MGAKKAITVLIVAMLTFCSLIVIAADDKAVADDENEKSILLDYRGVDYANISKVTTYPVDEILECFVVNPFNNEDNFDIDAKMDDVSHSYGYKKVADGDSVSAETFYVSATDFTVKLTAKNDGVKLKINGGPYEKYVKENHMFADYENEMSNFAKGDIIEFSGTMKKDHYELMKYDLYKNSSQEYLVIGSHNIMKDYLILDGEVRCKGDVFDFNVEMKQDISNTNEMSFSKELDDVVRGDPCTAYANDTNRVNLNVSIGKNIDSKKGIVSDVIKVDRDNNESDTERDSEASTMTEGLLEMLFPEVTVYELPLTRELKDKTEKEIEKTIADSEGRLSHNVNDFDGMADRIDNDVNGKSSNTDYTMLFAIIGVVIALILVFAFLVWRYRHY